MKDSTRRFVLLKLTTDRHEASRGLFVTAELLVIYTLITYISVVSIQVIEKFFLLFFSLIVKV